MDRWIDGWMDGWMARARRRPHRSCDGHKAGGSLAESQPTLAEHI